MNNNYLKLLKLILKNNTLLRVLQINECLNIGLYGESLELFRLIREMGVIRERPLLIETIRALVQGEIQLLQDTVISKQRVLELGLCMNHEIERSI